MAIDYEHPAHVVRIGDPDVTCVLQESNGHYRIEWKHPTSGAYHGTLLPLFEGTLHDGDVIEMFGAGCAMDGYRINGSPMIWTQWVGMP